MTDDDWPEPEPWGWRGNTASIVAIVAAAVGLHYAGVFAVKPPVGMYITTFNIPKTNQYCHPAKFYSVGFEWYCVR